MRLRLALCLVALPAVGPAVAPAQVRPGESATLWATVNVCDTDRHQDTLGIRGSMPGTGSARDEMFMRFRAQYYDPVGRKWHNPRRGGDSGFVSVGSGRYRARQAGHLFRFATGGGRRYRLRGAITFEWRRDGRVRRREKLLTTAGHRSSAGADPRDYSARVCIVG